MSCASTGTCADSLDLTMVRDKTGIFFLSIYQQDGTTPQDLTGATLYFHASYSLLNLTIDKNSPTNGITITATAGGADCATLTIDPADTTGFSTTGTAQFPFELTMQVGSSEFELARGTLTMYPNVGTP